MKKVLLFIITLLSISFYTVYAQYTTLNAHSHNDYANDIPFRLAYNNHFGSIEADIFAVNGDLYVAHNKDEIKSENTTDNSNAWETYMKMHIDYLNTDHIVQLSEYLNNRGK